MTGDVHINTHIGIFCYVFKYFDNFLMQWNLECIPIILLQSTANALI